MTASIRPGPGGDLFRARIDDVPGPAPRPFLAARSTPTPGPRPEPDGDRTHAGSPSGAHPSAGAAPGRGASPDPSPMRTTLPLPRQAPAAARPSGMRAVALAGVLLAGGLGIAGVLALSGAGPAPTTPVATVPVADRISGDITAEPVDVGTAVDLPGPRSLDWIALGADSTGSMVRADVDEEPLEFRAADTRPGLDGPFRVTWTDARRAGDGSSAGQLGIAPGGRVELLVRPQPTGTRLVLQVSGEAVTVTARTGDGAEIGTATTAGATVVDVPLPASTAATVTVQAAGGEIVGIAAAELTGG